MVQNVGAPWMQRSTQQPEDDRCRSLCSVRRTESENPL